MDNSPRYLKIDCEKFQNAVRAGMDFTFIICDLLELIVYLKTGETPSNPRQTFTMLFDDVKAEREAYLKAQQE